MNPRAGARRAYVDWQRQTTRDLAEGRFGDAVAALDKVGAITVLAPKHSIGSTRRRITSLIAAGRGARVTQ
jgi:hypothetical protein